LILYIVLLPFHGELKFLKIHRANAAMDLRDMDGTTSRLLYPHQCQVSVWERRDVFPPLP